MTIADIDATRRKGFGSLLSHPGNYVVQAMRPGDRSEDRPSWYRARQRNALILLGDVSRNAGCEDAPIEAGGGRRTVEVRCAHYGMSSTGMLVIPLQWLEPRVRAQWKMAGAVEYEGARGVPLLVA
jgi:hypothetical protein